MQIAMESRAERVVAKQQPWWCMALLRPVIVDPAELHHRPWPVTVRHASVLEHGSDFGLGDADGPFCPGLH
eukprot:3934765-Rhodomonas_salina.1